MKPGYVVRVWLPDGTMVRGAVVGLPRDGWAMVSINPIDGNAPAQPPIDFPVQWLTVESEGAAA